MEEKQENNIIRTRIVELEGKLMDLMEISIRYENIPVLVFEHEMNLILKEIEYLENLSK